MAVSPMRIGQRNVLATGAVVCQGTEDVTISVQAISVKFSFASRPNEQPRIDYTAQGKQLGVVVVNADLPPDSPLLEINSSFVVTVGQTAPKKDIVMALYIQSRGQTKTRQITYTFSA